MYRGSVITPTEFAKESLLVETHSPVLHSWIMSCDLKKSGNKMIVVLGEIGGAEEHGIAMPFVRKNYQTSCCMGYGEHV